MTSEAPPFWWQEPDWRSVLLWPAALAWGRFNAARYGWTRQSELEAPVIMVASLAIGASGRTLAAAALAKAAMEEGRKPGLLLSGTPGAVPHAVDRHHDLAKHVGDAALQLAEIAPTVVAADRLRGARLHLAEGRDMIIVADGRVGDQLRPDLTIAVVDARSGLGNGKIAPAGPVRAPLTEQLARVDALLRFDRGDAADIAVRLAARAAKPTYDAALRCFPDRDLTGKRVLLFSGVRDPARYGRLAESAGAIVIESRIFGDGHGYADDEIDDLSAMAEKLDALPLTTPQDLLRLAQAGARGIEFAALCAAIGAELDFEVLGAPAALIRSAHSAWMRRSRL